MTPERKAQMRENLERLARVDPMKAFKTPTAYQETLMRMSNHIVNPPLILGHPTVVLMKRVRRARAERLRALRLRPWWRKVWDGVVYVVTGREP